MRSSSRPAAILIAAVAVGGITAPAVRAEAQCQPNAVPGFSLDRFYQSAPGGGWMVMDTLDMHGGLGGAAALTTEYGHDPLRVKTADDAQHLTVVSDEAIADVGFAGTYDRWRFYVNLAMPLDVAGNSGTVGAYSYCAPNAGQPYTPSGVNPSTTPDAFADARVGLDVRLLGESDSPFRLGLGAQLFIPSPNTPNSEYLTDGTFRAMFRILAAGDAGWFSYAAQLGIHLRPVDDAPVGGSPRGNELLFGAAAGWKYALDPKRALVIGPEVYGETAVASFFGTDATGLEGLVTARVEGTEGDGPQIRIKLGAGAGLDDHFGTPEWRLVAGIELFDHSVDSDGDGVTDRNDACPHVAGLKTKDPKTNGCPPPSASPEKGVDDHDEEPAAGPPK